jgi:hypothetical protein
MRISRHAPDRAKLTKLRGLEKRRQRQQFEGYCESVQGDPDTSNVGRIVPADQYHPYIIPIALPRHTALAHGGHPGIHAAGSAAPWLAGTTATVLAGGHTHIQQMNFSKCELPHTPRPIPERRWRAWADGLSICEMSVYQEAILVAEGT